MRKGLFALVLVLAVSALFSDKASACSCRPNTPAQVLEKVEMVFTAEVVSIEYPDISTSKNRYRIGDPRVVVTLRVANVWKGDAGETVVMNTWQEFSACSGAQWKIGESFLVYAYHIPAGQWANQVVNLKESKLDLEPNGLPADQSVLTTGICMRTRSLKYAAEDLKVLGVGKAP